MSGDVLALYIGPVRGEPMQPVDEVVAIEGSGLEGDRYSTAEGTFGRSGDPSARGVTLIESEAIAAAEAEGGFELGLGEPRRNVVTRGVALNHLVGREFAVGEVRLEGIKLSEPCKHLEDLTGKKLRRPLIHRGGLRARIVRGGVIRVGDSVEVPAP